MVTKPVRLYLLLLFIAVFGIGYYLILSQNNADIDAANSLTGQSVKETPAPTATPATSETSLNVSSELNELDTLLSGAPSTDFEDDGLSTTDLGI